MRFRIKPGQSFFDRITRITYREGSIIDIPEHVGRALYMTFETEVPEKDTPKIIPFIPANPIPETPKQSMPAVPKPPPPPILRRDVLPIEVEEQIEEEIITESEKKKLIAEFEIIRVVKAMRDFAKEQGISLSGCRKKATIRKRILSELSR
ncbi:hypothetical protein KKA53_04855 [Candidatus Dependentiae bacterium]|nr:hypothetical protein [Candidatus Dependentiae bacterium]